MRNNTAKKKKETRTQINWENCALMKIEEECVQNWLMI